MKKIAFIVILFLMNLNLAQAQYFSVKEWKADDPYEGESVFPEFIAPESKSAWPEMAAERINTYLKYDVLMKVHGDEGDNLFSEVFPDEGEFGGEGEYSYSVISNNARFVSIGINNSFTGAYTEYQDRNYVFSSTNGEHLTLHDFFSAETYYTVQSMAADQCAQIIKDYLQSMDPEDEFAEDKRWMYEECLGEFENERVPYFNFYLTDSSFVFTRYRCSNHMMAALDDLWTFNISYTFDELERFLSEKGHAILFKEHPANSDFAPEAKVLSGTLDGKYPIHAIFHTLSSEYGLQGVYWYDKYKKPIQIYGSVIGENKYEFWEEVKGEKFARIELMYQNGQIMGVWERVDGSNSLPVSLRLD